MTDLPPIQQVLQRHGLHAKKSLGQHFLLDLTLTDKIARLATPHACIIEIGPGPGALTRSLLENHAEHVIAIEMDDRFMAPLTEIKAAYHHRLESIAADALNIDIAKLSNDRPLRICANLPYNVGTKLLINWLQAKPLFWDKLVLMFQKEVAERIVACPGEAHYGRLAVLAGSVAKARIAFEIPACAFTPPPKIDSAVVVLEALAPENRFADLKLLGQITAAAFGQRRKMLRSSLKTFAKDKGIHVGQWLERADIDPTLRPEQLDISGFHTLAQALQMSNFAALD